MIDSHKLSNQHDKHLIISGRGKIHFLCLDEHFDMNPKGETGEIKKGELI